VNKTPQRLAAAAALLFLIGAFTGIVASAAMVGKLDAHGGSMLAAHLNGLMGCFWILGLAFTWQWVKLGDTLTIWLARLTVIAAYANWGVTVLKSFMKVTGIDYTGDGNNDFIFGILTVSVVIPTILSAFLWTWGLFSGLKADPA